MNGLLAPVYTAVLSLLGRLTAERAANLDAATPARLANLEAVAESRMAKLDTLESRLTAARAALLDQITAARMARLDADISSRAPASTAVSNAVLTSARIGNLDQIAASRMALIDALPAHIATLEALDARFPAVRAALIDALSPDGPTSRRFAVFTESGTWTVPQGIHTITVTLVGGGSGGLRFNDVSSITHYYQGGAGRLVSGISMPVTPGDILSVTIGAGGLFRSSAGAAGSGGDTIIVGSSGTSGIKAIGSGGPSANSSYPSQGNQGANPAPYPLDSVSSQPQIISSGSYFYPYGAAGVSNATTLTSGTSGIAIIEY